MARIADADLKLLRIFSTIAECGGFAAAQAELNLSAASISSYMSAIEQRLGVRLCSRGRAGFALTDKGAIVYRETQRLLAAVNEFSASAGALRGQLTGSLRIGVVDCTLTDPASPLRAALGRFNARDHDVRIEFCVRSPQDLQRAVLDDRLDLAVGSFPARIAALSAQALYRERNEFYCGPGHPLFGRGSVAIDDIRAGRIVARGYWRRADLNRIGVEQEAATVDNMEAQAMLILSGAYLGYLPAHFAAHWVARSSMCTLLPELLAYEAPFTLITKRGRAPVMVVRRFIEDLMLSLPGDRAAGTNRGAARRRSGHGAGGTGSRRTSRPATA
jgi:DNA-binding transcriptional LysR family regulator